MQMTSFSNRWLYLKTFCAICILPGWGMASEIDDCLLTGLKGISSDVAAQMVRQACENKIAAKKKSDLYDKYGEYFYKPIKVVSTNFSESPKGLFDGRATVVVENDLPVTAILVKLTLWTDFGLLEPRCGRKEDVDQYRYLFKMKIKPGSQAKLVVDDFRKFSGTILCATAEIERGREPKMTDVSFGTHSVMTYDEAREMSKALGVGDWVFSPTSIVSRQK